MTRKTTPDIMTDILAGAPATDVQEIPYDLIDDNPRQPRQVYDPAGLKELASSIERNGLQQAPAARRMPDGRVQLKFGHRRKRAWGLLRAKDPDRYERMPLVIVQATDADMSDHAWAENKDRQGLSAVEEAIALQADLDDFGWSQAELARRRGMSAAALSNKLRLLRAPEEVQTAINAGKMSERQAASLAPLWDLPEEAQKQIFNRGDYYGSKTILQTIESGASSDQVRRRVNDSIEAVTYALSRSPWTETDLGLGERVESATCGQCAKRITVGGAPRCPVQHCLQIKDAAWSERENAALVAAAGVPALPGEAGWSDTENFWGENLRLAGEYGIGKAPLCERLRIVADAGSDGLRIDGVEGGKLVCYHKGQKCVCLAKIKRDLAKDGKAAWERTRRQTVETLTAALSAPTADTLRLLAWYHAPHDKRGEVASWRAEDVVAVLVKAMLERVQIYEPTKEPDRARQEIEEMLAQAFITPPWSLAATLAPIDLVAQLRGRLAVHIAWLWAQTTRFAVPSAEELEQVIDDTREIFSALRGGGMSIDDELANQADAANQSALEMLDLVAAGYGGSPEVSWIVNTPISDINARSALERASADDLRWSLAVARVQTDSKTRIKAIQRRLRQLSKEPTS